MRALITALILVFSSGANAVEDTQDAITELNSIGSLSIACADGDKDACERANELDRKAREISASDACVEPETSEDALLCGFAEGYVTGAE